MSPQKKKSDGSDEELKKLKEMAARAQADLQNAKERMQKEGEDIRTFAQAGLVMKLLPTIDNFQRAFEHLPEDLEGNEWVQGLFAIEQGLVKELEGVGLSKIPSLGEVADPQKHEVLQVAEGDKDVIVQVLEEGYELNGKVLRPAKVVVGQG